MRKVSGFLPERALRMQLLGGAVRCGMKQYSRVYFRLLEVAAGLDATEIPEIYVTNSPVMNAMTIGVDKPIIVMNSALVNSLDDDELRFVIGHELGHALSGHALYRTMVQVLLFASQGLNVIPFSALGFRAIGAALLEWQRKSELSADRAGLLATQDVDAAIRTLMKLAGNGTADDLDTEAFLSQGREYSSSDDARDIVARTLFTLGQSHPQAVIRATELDAWVRSGEYQQILDGTYPHRSADSHAKLTDDASKAATSYSGIFNDLDDFLSTANRQVSEVASEAKDFVTGLFKK